MCVNLSSCSYGPDAVVVLTQSVSVQQVRQPERSPFVLFPYIQNRLVRGINLYADVERRAYRLQLQVATCFIIFFPEGGKEGREERGGEMRWVSGSAGGCRREET